MAGDTEDRFWKADELEILVQWIEEPGNQARSKKGSGLPKKAALAPLVDRLAARNSQQVFDEFNNIKRSHESRTNEQSARMGTGKGTFG